MVEVISFPAFNFFSFNGAAPARARMGARRWWSWRNFFGFNGAAPARARMDVGCPPNVPALPRFNGAAPARARMELFRGDTFGLMLEASTGPRPRGRGWINLLL